jgi:uncharacterized membrane protein (UPF0127 family)
MFASIGFIKCTQKKSNPVKEKQFTFKKEGNLSILSKGGDTIAQFEIEIADTPYERQTGLMYREELLSGKAMLFVFEKNQMRGFYMKNTLISLDLIFIDAGLNITHMHPNAKPFDTESISSKYPVKYVLEINAGLCEILNIENGMKINFNRL